MTHLSQQAREGADILTEARKAMRKVRTQTDALAWRDEYLFPHFENDAVYDDLTAMDAEMVRAVMGAGGG